MLKGSGRSVPGFHIRDALSVLAALQLSFGTAFVAAIINGIIGTLRLALLNTSSTRASSPSTPYRHNR